MESRLDFIEGLEAHDREVRKHIVDNACISVELDRRGADNMRRDEEHCSALQTSPTSSVFIRLYSWFPRCLSLGANQRESDVDAESLRRRGIDCVRRATGGRAVLHAEELTYSVVMCLSSQITARDVYRVSHHIIRDALQELGAHDIVFQKTQTDFAARYRTAGDSVSCFTSAARSELLWNNRKVVGSAQRVQAGVLLQHGSILLCDAHLELADCLALTDNERRALRDSMLCHSVSMHEITGSVPDMIHCVDVFQRSFSTRE